MRNLTSDQETAYKTKQAAWASGEISAGEYSYQCLKELGKIVIPCESIAVEGID